MDILNYCLFWTQFPWRGCALETDLFLGLFALSRLPVACQAISRSGKIDFVTILIVRPYKSVLTWSNAWSWLSILRSTIMIEIVKPYCSFTCVGCLVDYRYAISAWSIAIPIWQEQVLFIQYIDQSYIVVMVAFRWDASSYPFGWFSMDYYISILVSNK